jgi:hypothetical protein
MKGKNTMNIYEYTPENFNKLESYWKKLERGGDMTAFQLYDWYFYINQLYFKEKTKNIFRKWIYLYVEEQGKPVIIAPVQIVKVGGEFKSIGLRRGAYFIGRQGYSDYLNFIYDEFSEDAVIEIFKFLKEKYLIKHFCFENLLGDSKLYQFIKNNYNYQQHEIYCVALELPETFEEYKALLSKHSRQNIRTALNRQKKDNIELTHELIYDMDETLELSLMNIREQRLGKKKKDDADKSSWKGRIYGKVRSYIRRFFCAKHNVIKECCNPWCFLVWDKTRIVSFFWGVRNVYKGEYYVIFAGVDNDYAKYTPSLSHLYLYIQDVYEKSDNEIKVIDFTRGDEKYKSDMGGKKKDLWTIRFNVC